MFGFELALRKWVRRARVVGELRVTFFFLISFILVINTVETGIFPLFLCSGHQGPLTPLSSSEAAA